MPDCFFPPKGTLLYSRLYWFTHTYESTREGIVSKVDSPMICLGVEKKGMIWVSQVAPGHENGLKLRVYGTKGGIEWVQADPNYLWYTPFGQPKQLITRAGAGATSVAARLTRVPSGHPEGYLEGFANIYSEAALAIKAARVGKKPLKSAHFPTIDDGVKGLAFVEAAVNGCLSIFVGGYVKYVSGVDGAQSSQT